MKTDFWVKKYCGIYCIQNKTTGMAYVGQSVDIVKRWSAHTTPGKKSSGIQKAIKECGIESFHFFVLEICAREDLNDKEIHWIKTYDCIHPKGYNGNSGGGAPTKVSDEAKKKMSAAGKGRKFSEETRSKMSAAKKVANISEETRSKLSAAAKGNTNGLGKKPPRSPEHCANISAARKKYFKKKKALSTVNEESPLD